jgi:hypothetical protein
MCSRARKRNHPRVADITRAMDDAARRSCLSDDRKPTAI